MPWSHKAATGLAPDPLLLTIEPIILGGGETIFAEDGKVVPFTLASTAKASSGARHYL